MTVTPYNFQKPGPLGSALEHKFAGWLQAACALATRQWTKLLPFSGEAYFLGSDTFLSKNCLANLPDAVVGYRLTVQDTLHTMLAWPRPVVLAVVAGLMCDNLTQAPADRELTPVEEALFEFFLKDVCLPSFQETWPGAEPIKLDLGAKETHPKWTRLFAPDESVVVSTFLMKAPFGEHEWRWILPKKGLLEFLDQSGHGAGGDPGAIRQRLETLVRDLPVKVCVALGNVELRLSDLAQLRAGDVILLNQRVSQPLTAWIAGEKKLRGWPGRVGSRQAFQIESFDE